MEYEETLHKGKALLAALQRGNAAAAASAAGD
jgi:hypothetical protein